MKILSVLVVFAAGVPPPTKYECSLSVPTMTERKKVQFVALDESDPKFASETESVKLLLRQQAELDENNRLFTPLLEFVADFIAPGEMIVPRIFIHKSGQSATFSLLHDPPRVIKYQANCGNDNIHPVLRDGWALQRLESSGFVPKLYFVSPATPLRYNYTVKTNFKLEAEKRHTCVNTEHEVVRSIVLEHVGESVSRYLGGGKRLTLKEALRFGVSLIEILRRLHDEFTMVHGDIHMGNVIRNEKGDIKLIDFGRALYKEEIKDTLISHKIEKAHCFYGLHEVEGFTRSFTDDLLRALFGVAFALNGTSWLDVCLGLSGEAKRAESIEFKSKTFVFELESLPKVMLEDLSGDLVKYEAIKAELAEVLAIARADRKPSDRPPYEHIISLLQYSISIIYYVLFGFYLSNYASH